MERTEFLKMVQDIEKEVVGNTISEEVFVGTPSEEEMRDMARESTEKMLSGVDLSEVSEEEYEKRVKMYEDEQKKAHRARFQPKWDYLATIAKGLMISQIENENKPLSPSKFENFMFHVERLERFETPFASKKDSLKEIRGMLSEKVKFTTACQMYGVKIK